MIQGQRDGTDHHCECLPTSGLTVGKDRAVISIHNIYELNQSLCLRQPAAIERSN